MLAELRVVAVEWYAHPELRKKNDWRQRNCSIMTSKAYSSVSLLVLSGHTNGIDYSGFQLHPTLFALLVERSQVYVAQSYRGMFNKNALSILGNKEAKRVTIVLCEGNMRGLSDDGYAELGWVETCYHISHHASNTFLSKQLEYQGATLQNSFCTIAKFECERKEEARTSNRER